MAASMVILGTVFQLMLLLICSSTAQNLPYAKIFSVLTYGAVPNGKTDSSNPFLSAWKDACQWNGDSLMFIPSGIYLLNPLVLMGPCNGPIGVRIEGYLKASTDPSTRSEESWISFQYIDQLVVDGDGVLDGQGPSAWKYNCQGSSDCQPLPISLRFGFVKNTRINNLKLINSKGVHLKLFQCQQVNISGVRIVAPENSPNTDGINIAESQDIQVTNCQIGTGDDCISMLCGNQNVQISDVYCGPGHGISVGSLGQGGTDAVKGLHVRNCSLSGTQNGLRIKTFAPSLPVTVSDFVYEDIHMDKADNPIIIDQQYCLNHGCSDQQAQSLVQIHNVTFKNIWGESGTQVAVNLRCSGRVPCTGIKLDDIDLVYNGRDGPARSQCSNAHGYSLGRQQPPACLMSYFN